MNRQIGFTIFLALVASAHLGAQPATNANTPQAQTPVAVLRPGMTWKVDLLPDDQRTLFPNSQTKRPATSGGSSTKVLEENVVGSGGFLKQTLYIEGRKLVRYAVGKMVVIESSDTSKLTIEPSSDEIYGGPISARRVQEFSWLSPEYYVGTTSVDGEDCDIYAAPWPSPQAPNASPRPRNSSASTAEERGPTMLAAISKKSRLPVRLEDPIQIRRYTFGSTKNPPVLPEEVMATLKRQEEAIRAEIQKYNLPQ